MREAYTKYMEMPNRQSALDAFLRNARIKHVPGGQIIFYESDVPSETYIIKSGVVKMYDIDEQGNEKILHLVKAPALIPFAFFTGEPVPLRWFYSTVTDCEFYTMQAADVRAAIRQILSWERC